MAILATVYCHAVGNFFQPGGAYFDLLDWHIGGVNVSLAKLLDSGGLGVDLFFFLSAFVLYRPYVAGTRRMESRRDVIAFLRHRSARLLPLYFFCGLASLFITRRFDVFNPEQWLVFGEFIVAGHIFDMKNFTPGYNWVYWSITLEIWFSFIFPAIVILFRAPLTAALTLSVLPVAVWGAHTYFPNELPHVPFFWLMVVAHLPSFALGMLAVHTLDHNPVQKPGLRLPSLVLAVLLVALGSRGGITVLVPAVPGTSENLSAAIGFYLLFVTVTRSEGPLNTLLRSRWLQVLGMMCYSIYVWHGIMMAYIMGQDPTPGGRMFLMLPYLPLMLAVAALSYRYIEFPGRPVAELFLLRRGSAPSRATTSPAWTAAPAWVNGLCGVAILVVLACDTTGLFWRGTGTERIGTQLFLLGIPDPGAGAPAFVIAFSRLGIDLLIVLGAFLLYRPFADGRQPMDRAAAIACYRRQAGRLVPLYAFCGLISFVLSFTFHPYEIDHWRWMGEFVTAGHLFFTSDFLPPYNWSLWVLILGIWGCLLFPLAVLAFRYAALPTTLAACLLPWAIPLFWRKFTGEWPSLPLLNAAPAHVAAAILGMTAAWVLARGWDLDRWRRPLLAAAALLVVGGAASPGPAGVLATAIGFTLLTVALGATSGRLNAILGWWPLQWLGVMAVSLLAWHLVVAHRLIDQGVTPAGKLAAAAVFLGALFALAALSYRYFEFGHLPLVRLFPRSPTRTATESAAGIAPAVEERPRVPAGAT